MSRAFGPLADLPSAGAWIEELGLQQLWEVRITRESDGRAVAQGRVRLQNVPLRGFVESHGHKA